MSPPSPHGLHPPIKQNQSLPLESKPQTPTDLLWSHQLRRENAALRAELQGHIEEYRRGEEVRRESERRLREEIGGVKRREEEDIRRVEGALAELRGGVGATAAATAAATGLQAPTSTPSTPSTAVAPADSQKQATAQHTQHAHKETQPTQQLAPPQQLSRSLRGRVTKAAALKAHSQNMPNVGLRKHTAAMIAAAASGSKPVPVVSESSAPMPTDREIPSSALSPPATSSPTLSLQASTAASPAATRAAELQYTPDGRPMQGTLSLAEYAAAYGVLARRMGTGARRDLLGGFMRGLRETRDKVRVVEGLESLGLATFDRRTSAVDFLCGWEEVEGVVGGIVGGREGEGGAQRGL